ncbi:MAG: DNA-binding protein WhiA [Clostridia bacterium]|nr:DNA-binding protein WhiA [Clostridia bacterium]
MSYSSDLKQQLAEKEVKKKCCRRALLYGMLAVRGTQAEGKVSLTLEKESVAPLAAELCRTVGKEVSVTSVASRFPRSIVTFSSPAACAYLAAGEMTLPPDGAACPQCLSHFLRGVFLAAGRMSDYKKLYRLEFSAKERTEALYALLASEATPPRQTERRGEKLLYYKTNSEICDFMAGIGAETAAFELINDSIEAGYRNAANRRANCETRNIERSVEASMRFVHTYRRLVEADKLSLLSEDLQETARLRAENPTASLALLGARHSPPITKSGMNHRLEKILRLAEDILKR